MKPKPFNKSDSISNEELTKYATNLVMMQLKDSISEDTYNKFFDKFTIEVNLFSATTITIVNRNTNEVSFCFNNIGLLIIEIKKLLRIDIIEDLL